MCLVSGVNGQSCFCAESWSKEFNSFLLMCRPVHALVVGGRCMGPPHRPDHRGTCKEHGLKPSNISFGLHSKQCMSQCSPMPSQAGCMAGHAEAAAQWAPLRFAWSCTTDHCSPNMIRPHATERLLRCSPAAVCLANVCLFARWPILQLARRSCLCTQLE